jgi:hypothetical protein
MPLVNVEFTLDPEGEENEMDNRNNENRNRACGKMPRSLWEASFKGGE